MEEQMMLHQQQLAQQQKTMEWMTEQMSQQRDHMRMLAMQPAGVTLPPLAPPPFTFPWVSCLCRISVSPFISCDGTASGHLHIAFLCI
jgi:hypothetical protein